MRRALIWSLVAAAMLFGCKGCKKNAPDDQNVVDFADLVLERCGNGEDDNVDGLTDCEDPVCQLDESCVFEPPDPAGLAPDPTSSLTDFASSVSFLWEGDNPVVRGVDPDALDMTRVAVVRVQLLDAAGNPVKGVRANIAGRPALGYTFSRDDGMVDLVMNGGEQGHVRVGGGDYLTVDRVVEPERLAYAWADDVVMTHIDAKSTALDFRKKKQLANGTTMDDASGSRTARLYFPPGTVATARLPDGQRGALDAATVRLTEYTVGETGMAAMPAGLPEDSAYTYAVELSLDEAREVGADEVTFSKPVSLYLDNFLGFDVGTTVPSGFYLRYATEWAATPNGLVMMRTADGVAVSGRETADKATREALGITKEELELIAETFAVGETFWRVPVEHFSPCDLNWPYEFPPDAVSPDEIPDYPSTREDDPCAEAGSRIECQNQVMSREISLPGTPLGLVYRSDRVAGSGHRFEIPLTGDSVVESLEKIVVTVDVAGRYFETEYEPAPNLSHVFEWDGLDAYGRHVDGKWPIRVRVGFFYAVSYTEPPRNELAFAQEGGDVLGDGRRILPIWSTYRGLFGSFDALRAHGLGGWTFDELYSYDSSRQILYPGAGPEQKASTTGRVIRILDRFRDASALPFDPKTFVTDIVNVAVAPDDSLVIHMKLVSGSSVIIRRRRDGSLEHIAGRPLTGEQLVAEGCRPTCGMDGPATDAVFNAVHFALGADGTPYFAQGSCVYGVRDGQLDLLDDCNDYDRPDGSADVRGSITSFLVTPDGDLLLSGGERILRIRAGSRFIEQVGGCVTNDCQPLGLSPSPARDTELFPDHLTQAPNGDIYFAQRTNGAVALLDSGGRVHIVTGPEDAREIRALDFGRDGRLYAYVLDELTPTIRVLAGTNWQVVAGAAFADLDPLSNVWSSLAADDEPIPATSTIVFPFGSLTADTAGRVYLGSLVKNPEPDADPSVIPGIQEISTVFPPNILGEDETLIPSRDGSRLYRFDADGRHLQTLDANTMAVLMEFERDADGWVTAVIDGDGNRTEVERQGGHLAAVVGPWGHRVEFGTDDAGYIESISAPDGSSSQVGLGYDGLMESWTDPRGEVSQYEYDSVGRLTRAEDAAGGWKTLTRRRDGSVDLETASGRQTYYGYQDPVTRETVLIDAAGLEWRTKRVSRQWVESTRPDGTVTTTVMRSDPRFGLLASYVGDQTVTLPSGLSQELSRRLSVTTADPNDLTTLQSLDETVSIGDDMWTLAYDAPSRTLTKTSAAGRVRIVKFDDQRRVVSEQVGSFAPIEYEYDVEGSLVTIRQAGAEATLTYGADGFLSRADLPAGSVTYQYDEMGRLAAVGDGVATHGVTRDARGAPLTTDVAGGLLSYSRTFDEIGLPSSFSMPDGATHTYAWDFDHQLATGTLPSGRMVGYDRDEAHRLTGVTTTEGDESREYDEVTGLMTRATSPGVGLDLTYDGMLVTKRAYTVEGISADVTRRLGDGFLVTRQSVKGQNVDISYDADGIYTSVGPVTLTPLPDAEAPETVEVGSIQTTLTYDEQGVVTATEHAGPNGPLFSESATNIGGVAQTISEEVLGVPSNWAFTYDAAGRLTGATLNGSSAGTYAYDDAGQRTSIDGTAVSYDAGGRTAAIGATTYAWDADGRLSGIDDGTTQLALTHDTLGQLTRAEVGGQVAEYRYSPRGYRVARIIDGVVDAVWVYDETSRPVAELDASGNIVARFVYATTGIVPDAMLKDGKTYRIIRDRRHSVRLVVDAATGQVEQQIEYDPLGRVLSDSNPGFQPFGFGGGIQDGFTGFVHMGKRDYDPRSGRWTTPDPGGFSDVSTNLYQYALGDPINRIDPDGDIVIMIVAGLGATVAVLAGAVALWNHEIHAVQASGWKARRRYWGEGGRGGIENGLRHCTGQCDAARTRGTFYARMSAAYHELPVSGPPGTGGWDNTFDDPENGVDKAADVISNHCGRQLAEEGDPNKDCVDLCQEAIDSGRLPIPARYHWKSDTGRVETNLRMRVKRARRMGLIN